MASPEAVNPADAADDTRDRPHVARRAARWTRGRSIRRFVFELLTITAGVFIALSVDSVRQWREHRQLVAEARATIAREIADNRREIEGSRGVEARRQRDAEIGNAVRFAGELLSGSNSPTGELRLGIGLSELSSAGWQTAARTGALGYMDYAEVQRHSRLYALQDLYETQQRRVLDRLIPALTLLQHDPTKAPKRDVELLRQHLLELRGELTVLDQIADRLSKVYGEALEK
jgi:hypothetical protein